MSSLWNRRSVAALMLLGGLAACDEPVPLPPPDGGGGGGTPLVISSPFPPFTENFVSPYGLPVSAVSSQPLNASTATVSSFTITEDPGADVSRRILVIGGTTIQATATLLPNQTYHAEITRSLQSTTGSTVAAPYTWTFKTRPIVTFPLASSTTPFFGHLALAADSSGGLHAVYADSVNGDFFYAECAGNCSLQGSWHVLGVDTVGNIGSSSAIGVDRTGRVHIVYRSDRLQTLQYATCITACTDLTSWSFATVDNSSSLIGINPSIAVTPDGVVHTTYYDGINLFLRYARCLAACTLDASWEQGTPDTSPGVGRSSAIVVDGAIRHVVYEDSTNRTLKYATCATSCVAAEIWNVNPVTLVDGGQNPSLALGPNKELAVTYFAALGGSSALGSIKYASCLNTCLTFANWTNFELASTGLVGQGNGVTMDVNGRVQAIFIDNGLARLRYATCSSVCTSSARWRYSTVDDGIGITRSAAMVPGRQGALEMLYLATDGTIVKFAE